MTSVIFDTSALIRIIPNMRNFKHIYTTESVLNEMKLNYTSYLKIATFVETQLLKVLTPSKEFIEKARRIATQLGEIGKISKTDLEIIALAIALGEKGDDILVITNDYSIQNILDHLNIRYKSIGIKGIRERRKYIYKCKNCHTKYNSKYNTCPKCGGRVVREVKTD